MIFDRLNRYRNVGLLIIRVGIGLFFMFAHGKGKLFGGPERWEQIGRNAQYVGLDFWPVFWGFMAGVGEFVGGLLLVLGLLFRPALFLLFCVMVTAASMHIATGQGSPYHSLEMAVLFTGLFFVGPGKYSLDAWLFGRRTYRRAHRGF